MQGFDGIDAKLARAYENILNLDKEIAAFFQKCDYPVIPENDMELLREAIKYHANLAIPPRFSVLASEIIHHLRSCFDHIVWHFTVQPVKNIRKIEFPVFDELPANNDGRKLFEGKIAGIADSNVRSLIERLQPYNAPDPLDDPLHIIHDFDIVDKHKEVVICAGTASRFIPAQIQSILESYEREHPELNSAQVAHHFKNYGPMMPYISFRDFGRRKLQPVIPGLTDLFNYTVKVVESFEVL
jgi:hypothetical protein